MRLWQVETGKEIGRLEGFFFRIENIVFSPDGKILAGSDSRNRIYLWDVASRKLLHPFDREEGFVGAVAYSPDGKKIAAACDRTIRLLEAQTGKELTRFEGHAGRILALAFSADGKSLASAGSFNDGTTRLWNLATGKESHIFKDYGGRVALSADGQFIASGQNPLLLRQLPSGKEIARLDHKVISGLAFSTDSKLLAVGNRYPYFDQGNSLVYSILDGKPLARFGLIPLANIPGNMHDLAFSPRGWVFAYTTYYNPVNFLEIEKGGKGRISKFAWERTGFPVALAYSPNGKILALGNFDGTISLHDADGAHQLAQFQWSKGMIKGLAYSPDGQTLTSVHDDGTALVWDVSRVKGKKISSSSSFHIQIP